jgi:hypothetical protein
VDRNGHGCDQQWAVLKLGLYNHVVVSQNCIVPSARKIMAVSHGFVNTACCMCEFSGLKGKVKFSYLNCILLRTNLITTLLQLCAEIDSG